MEHEIQPGKGHYTAIYTRERDGTWTVQIEGNENEIHASVKSIEEGRRVIREVLALWYDDAETAEINETIAGPELATRQEEAVSAIRLRAATATCYLAEPSKSVFDLSSGTLIRTPGGRFVVLTAAHCLKDYEKHSDEVLLGLPMAGEPWKGLIASWQIHPTADVGLVILEDGADGLSSHALDSHRVGPRPSPDCQDSVLLVGSPTAGVVVNPPEFGINTQQYYSAFQALRDADDGRWLLEWLEGELITLGAYAGAPRKWREYVSTREAVMRGKRVKLLKPHGMSGGGLWRIHRQPARGSELWYADRHLRLVGVQTAYRDPDVIIEPVSNWESWFQETVDAVDAG